MKKKNELDKKCKTSTNGYRCYCGCLKKINRITTGIQVLNQSTPKCGK
ncbi:MAG: hypothetical protein ACFFDF_15655 [Candidatus Odinarchaeota archaeon]